MTEYIKRDDMREVLEKASISPRFADEPPDADVAPVRHGRWVLIRPGEWTATLKCSECGRRITVDPKKGDLVKDYPYCHCGAKMDGE